MDRPLVSVVMPNYNDALYLREAVESVLGQSFPAFELVVVDDASSDESVAILSDYAARDPRVRLYRNDRNQGAVSTINRAASLARGTYLYFLASNDKALPGFFERTVALLEAHPRAGLCWTDPSHFFESYGPIYRRRIALTVRPRYLSPQDLAAAYREGRLSAPLHAAPAMFRRSAYEAAGGCLPELQWYSDFFVTLVVAFRCGMCHVPEALTATRVLAESYWRSGSAQKRVQEEVFARILELLTSPQYEDLGPLVERSGALAYFGLPMFRLARDDPRYRSLLGRRYLARCLRFSIMHSVRRRSSLRFQRLYFRVRQAVRSGAPAEASP